MPGFRHDCFNVREIDIDHARTTDDFCDARDGAVQHVVRGSKRFIERYLIAKHLHELVVRYNDQRVDMLGERIETFLRNALPLAFEREWFRDHGNGEDAELSCDFCNHWCRAGPRSAAHPGRKKQHVCATQQIEYPITIFDRGLSSHIRIGAGAQTLWLFPNRAATAHVPETA
jgi:hypothetical protein